VGILRVPGLYGDRLVGKLDATADRKAGVRRVNAIYQDVANPQARGPGAGPPQCTARSRDLAHWLELDLTLPVSAT